MNTLVIDTQGGGQSPAKHMILPIAHCDKMMGVEQEMGQLVQEAEEYL